MEPIPFQAVKSQDVAAAQGNLGDQFISRSAPSSPSTTKHVALPGIMEQGIYSKEKHLRSAPAAIDSSPVRRDIYKRRGVNPFNPEAASAKQSIPGRRRHQAGDVRSGAIPTSGLGEQLIQRHAGADIDDAVAAATLPGRRRHPAGAGPALKPLVPTTDAQPSAQPSGTVPEPVVVMSRHPGTGEPSVTITNVGEQQNQQQMRPILKILDKAKRKWFNLFTLKRCAIIGAPIVVVFIIVITLLALSREGII